MNGTVWYHFRISCGGVSLICSPEQLTGNQADIQT